MSANRWLGWPSDVPLPEDRRAITANERPSIRIVSHRIASFFDRYYIALMNAKDKKNAIGWLFLRPDRATRYLGIHAKHLPSFLQLVLVHGHAALLHRARLQNVRVEDVGGYLRFCAACV